MTRYTLHIPTLRNNGEPIYPAEVWPIEDRLLEVAGGYTTTEAHGAWRDPDTSVIYREPMRLYHVDTDSPSAGIELELLAVDIAQQFEQEAVYLTRQAVDVALVEPVRVTS